jgi:uncharacterized protein
MDNLEFYQRIRALALISKLVYGERPCWKDPAKFCLAPWRKRWDINPVDRTTYDHTIQTLHEAVEKRSWIEGEIQRYHVA